MKSLARAELGCGSDFARLSKNCRISSQVMQSENKKHPLYIEVRYPFFPLRHDRCRAMWGVHTSKFEKRVLNVLEFL